MTRGSPAAGELLDVWERAAGQRGTRRALSLLGVACPERSVGDLSRETVGKRDRFLLALRERIFGPRLDCTTDCPACHEALEFTLQVDDLEIDEARPAEQTLSVATERHSVAYRLPDSRDLLAVERECPNPEEAAKVLLERCVLEAIEEGSPIAPGRLPPEIVELVDMAMQEADGQADIEVSLACPVCASEWDQVFDIASYLWEELDAWARHVTRDVHTLATAYGWREDDILAMTAERRGAYLDLIRA